MERTWIVMKRSDLDYAREKTPIGEKVLVYEWERNYLHFCIRSILIPKNANFIRFVFLGTYGKNTLSEDGLRGVFLKSVKND